MFGGFKFGGANRLELFNVKEIALKRRRRNEARIRRLCASIFLGEEMALCRVLGRYKMFVDPKDAGLSPHLMLDGYWEMWLTEALIECVKPGMNCIDVGANLGYFTLVMADRVGPTGRVTAFEPNMKIAGLLRRNCDINGFGDRTTVHATPLSADDGARVRLVVPLGEPKNGHIIGADPDDPQAVTTRRLDSYPALLDADVIKIDAEGAEEAIWAGMAGLVSRRAKPLTVFLEFAADRYQDPEAFLAAIGSAGFSLQILTFRQGVQPVSVAALLKAPSNLDQMLVLTRAA